MEGAEVNQKPCNILFNSLGSAPCIAPISGNAGATAVLPSAKPYPKLNKAFVEWNTSQTGEGTSYKGGATVTIPNNYKATFYAIYQAAGSGDSGGSGESGGSESGESGGSGGSDSGETGGSGESAGSEPGASAELEITEICAALRARGFPGLLSLLSLFDWLGWPGLRLWRLRYSGDHHDSCDVLVAAN